MPIDDARPRQRARRLTPEELAEAVHGVQQRRPTVIVHGLPSRPGPRFLVTGRTPKDRSPRCWERRQR